MLAIAIAYARGVADRIQLAGKNSIKLVPGPDGVQEASIRIKGSYRPGTVIATRGVPLRLRFFRDEDDPCSERLIIRGMALEWRLPAYEETSVQFTPDEPGEFLFTCDRGIYRGRLIVEEPRSRPWFSRAGRRNSPKGSSTTGDGTAER